MGLGIYLVFSLLLAGVWAAPTPEPELCSVRCDPSTQNSLGYQVGKTYTYQYESTNGIALPGTTNDQGTITMTASVELHVHSLCDVSVKLKDVNLAGDHHSSGTDSASFKAALEAKPFLIAYDALEIDHICHDTSEPVWVSNIKRGIVSAMNLGGAGMEGRQSRNIVTDVHGHCETNYDVDVSGSKVTVKRSKVLSTCSENHGHITAIQADSFTSESPLPNQPVFRSGQDCETSIDGGIVQSVSCEEKHLLIAFSKDGKGATTTSTQKLKYGGESSGVDNSGFRGFVPGSLVFDYDVEPRVVEASAAQEVVAAVEELCKATKDDIRPEAPNVFTRLQYLIGRLPYSALKGLQPQVESGQLCNSKKTKDILLDAVATAGSEGSVKLIVELLKAGKVDKWRARIWYARIAFIKNPTPAIIGATLPLLEGQNPHKSAFLSVSSLAHAYCRKHENCEDVAEIKQLLELITRHLGNKCKSNGPEELNRVIAALKAFGNLGEHGQALPVLSECIRSPSLSIEVRVAALQAFRRMPCVNQAVMWDILDNPVLDPELRITAYLNLIQCANKKTFTKIKDLLEHEVVNQVGSFIWTHLTNLQETDARWKQYARRIVTDVPLQKKFRTDIRKYSANYEISNYIRNLNLGGSLESNVIFSPTSFLPRSVSVNMTLDVFGHSFNFIEVDVRASGLEHKLEELFGPTGKVKEQSLRSLVRKRLNEVVTDTRSKREIPYKPQKLKSLIERSPLTVDDQIEASVSVKIFGNELSWLNTRDFRKILAGDSGTRYGGAKAFFEKIAQEHVREFGRGYSIVDSTLVLASGTGIPIKLHMNATAILGYKGQGKIDFREAFKNPRHILIQGLAETSAAVEVSRSLVIDAHVAKCGLKLRRTTHTSRALDGSYEFKEGEELAVSLKLPRDKIELLNGKSEIFIIHNDMEHEVSLNFPDKYELKGCSVYLQEIFGVKLCGEAEIPRPILNPDRPYLPLGGPISFAITLNKEDPNQQGVVFRLLRKREAGHVKYLISYDTPGSQKSREVTLGYDHNLAAKQLEIKFITPVKKLVLKGQRVDTDNKYESKVTLTADDERVYDLLATLNKDSAGGVVTYRPNYVLTTPRDTYTLLKGTVVNNRGALTLDLETSDKIFGKPFSIKGNVALRPSANWNLNLGTPSLDILMVGQHQKDGVNHVVNNRFEYSFASDPGSKHTITEKLKYSNEGEKFLYDSEVLFSRAPDYNRKVHLEYNYGVERPNNKLDIQYGGDFSDPAKHIEIEWRLQKEGTWETGLHLERVLKIKYPRREIDFEHSSSFRYEKSRLLEHTFVVRNGLLLKSLDHHFTWRNSSTDRKNILVEWKLSIPDRELAYRRNIVEKKRGEYQGELLLQWQRGEAITVQGQIKDKGSDSVTHYETDHTINIHNVQNPIKVTGFLHCETGKHTFKVKYVRGNNQYNVDSSYVRKDEDNADFKADIKLPSIVGKITAKHAGNNRNADADIKLFNDRRIVGKATAKVDGATRSVLIDIKLDADADPNQKIVFTGTVIREPNTFRKADIQGTLQTPRKTFQLHVNYAIPEMELDGKHSFRAELDYDDNKKILIEADVDVDDTERGRRVSEGVLRLVSPYTDERKLVYATRIEKTEHIRGIGGTFRVSSPGLEDLIFEVSQERGHHAFGSSFAFGFGERVLKLGLGAKFLLEGDKKDVGFTIDVRTPIEGAKALVLSFNHYSQRNSDIGRVRHDSRVILFDPAREVALKIDWNRRGNFRDGIALKGEITLVTPIGQLKNPQGRILLEWEPSARKIDGELFVFIHEGRQVSANLDYHRTEEGIDGHLVIEAPHREYKKLDVKLTHTRHHPNYDTTIVAQWEPNKKLTYVAKRILEKNHIVINSVLTPPADSQYLTESKFSLEHDIKGDKRTGTATIEWGDKKVIFTGNTKGAQGGNFDTEILVTSPNYPDVNGWKLNAKRTVQGLNRQFVGKLSMGERGELELNTDVKGKANDGGGLYDLTVLLNGGPVVQATLDATYTGSSWRDDMVAVYKATLASPATEEPLHLETVVIRTVSDFIVKRKGCIGDGENNCFYETFGLEGIGKTNYAEGIVNRTLYWSGGYSKAGQKHTMGYYNKFFRVPGNLEYISRMTYNEEENKFVGLRVIGNRKSEGQKHSLNAVATLELPNREVKFNIVRNKDQRGYKANFDLALDATRDPGHKLDIQVDINNKPNDLYDVKVVINHPLLSKPATIKSLATYRHGHTLLKADTELDLGRDSAKKIVWDTQLFDHALGDPTAWNYSYVMGVHMEKPKPVNFQVAGMLGRHVGHALSKLGLTWENSEGLTRSLSLVGDVDRIHKSIHFMSESPIRRTEFTTRWWWSEVKNVDDIVYPTLKVNMDVKVNSIMVRKAYLDISRLPYLSLSYHVDPADPNRVFLLTAERENPKTFKISAIRKRDGQSINDINAVINLEQPQLLAIKANWRPGLLKEALGGAAGRLRELVAKAKEVGASVLPEFLAEVREYRGNIRQIVEADWSPLLLHTAEKAQKIQQEIDAQRDFTIIKTTIGMTKNFLKEFINIPVGDGAQLAPLIEGVRNEIREWFAGLITRFRVALKALAEGLPKLGEEIQHWREALQAWIESSRKNIQGLRQALEEAFRYDGPTKTLDAFRARVKEIALFLKDIFSLTIVEVMGIVQDGVANIRIGDVITKYAEWAAEYVERLKVLVAKLEENSVVFRELVNLIRDAAEKLKQRVAELVARVQENRRLFREKVKAIYEEALKSPEFKKLVESIREALEKIVKRLSDAGRKTLSEDIDIEDIQEYVKTFLGVYSEARFKINRETGELDAKVPLLVPVQSLRQLRETLFDFRQLAPRRTYPLTYRDFYYQIIQPFLKTRVRPPYEGTGVVIGNQHYITFDGRHYQFAGKCEYVLAQDGIDGNFSVVVNYDEIQGQAKIKSIVVVSDDHNVEIKPNFQVLLDDQEVELPSTIEKTVIKREWNNVVVTNNKGLSVSVDPKHGIYIVNVDGYYFAKTQGLLGTYNYEPSDDFLGPAGQNLTSVTAFANAWEVSRDCRHKENFADEKEARFGSPAHQLCEGLFKRRSSRLSSAFPVVDPRPYMHACVQDLGHTPSQSTPNEAVCRTASAYSAVAERRGFNLELPSVCGKLLS